MSDKNLRREGAGLMLRSLRSEARRAQLAELGHRSGEPIIIALDSDTLGEVFGRIMDEDPEPPALIAMYRPSSRSIVLWSIDPAGSGHSADLDHVPAGHAATIGMLYDAMRAEHRSRFDLVVKWAHSTTVRANELVDA